MRTSTSFGERVRGTFNHHQASCCFEDKTKLSPCPSWSWGLWPGHHSCFTLSLALWAPNAPASFLLNALTSSQLDTSHIGQFLSPSPWAQSSLLPASLPTPLALPLPSLALLHSLPGWVLSPSTHAPCPLHLVRTSMSQWAPYAVFSTTT